MVDAARRAAMRFTHLVAATDESDAGRQAAWTALELAQRAGGRVTVLRVVPPGGSTNEVEREQLQRWVESDLPPLERLPPIEYAVGYGLPGIEIARFADRVRADLVVLGRKPRSQMTRLLLGDTADAVARRSRVPCLFVSPLGVHPRRLLVALDGSVRGMAVLHTAAAFAKEIRADVRALTVEPLHAGEPPHLAAAMPTARSARLGSRVHQADGRPLEVRRGQPAEQILAAVEEHGPDVLVVGCHRGGPAGVIEGGSTSRRVIHSASCAVLTVPL
jgi:nucleotide-binding universal stress UspA family protein